MLTVSLSSWEKVMSLEEWEGSSSWYVRFTMKNDVLLLADPQFRTQTLIWHDAKYVMEVMSMADRLPRKLNSGSCSIKFHQDFSTCCQRKKKIRIREF